MFLFFFLVEQSFNYCLGEYVKEKKKQVANTNIKNLVLFVWIGLHVVIIPRKDHFVEQLSIG